MRPRAALVIAFLLWPVGAWAGLPQAVLDGIFAAPPPHARLPLSLSAPDTAGNVRTLGGILDGRPAFVGFVDYTCKTLCGTELVLLSDAVHRAGLNPAQFRIVIIGLDPKDPASAAITMEKKEVPEDLRSASVFLLPDKAQVDKATAALGYHFAYDPARDQFAHPAAIYVLGADGALRAVLSPLALTAGDLRGTLNDAVPPPLLKRILLLCYAFGPVTGIYSGSVILLLKIAAMATLTVLAGALLFLKRRHAQ